MKYLNNEIFRLWRKSGIVLHAFNPSTLATEADGPLWVWHQPNLHNDFQNSHSYIERPYPKQTNKKLTTSNNKEILKKEDKEDSKR